LRFLAAIASFPFGNLSITSFVKQRRPIRQGRCIQVPSQKPKRRELFAANKNSLFPLDCIYRADTVDAVNEKKSACLLPPISPAAGPLYQQIVDGFKREISEGRLVEGAVLPSFRQLAGELMVSVITVKRAYEELERDGIILRRQGLGTFVARNGDDRSRQLKTERAGELLRAAIREAREAGLAEKEIADLFRRINNKEKS
jgi:GntR family transcriptional regulator